MVRGNEIVYVGDSAGAAATDKLIWRLQQRTMRRRFGIAPGLRRYCLRVALRAWYRPYNSRPLSQVLKLSK